jgi:GNAT superfamily N-acetyltransferase
MISFRNATLNDLHMVLEWAAAEGWNPGLDDADAFYTADPYGFFVAAEGQEPVAAISVVNHSEVFAFLGLYIVKPAFRGRGIGFGLWEHALCHAGERTVGLDGVPEQQENYAESGFVHAGSTTRYTGRLAPVQDADIRLSDPDDIPALIDAEAGSSGYRKEACMAAWFRNGPRRKTIVADRVGPPSNFCTVRQCRDGAKVGPLVADCPETALRLLQHAAAVFADSIMIDVPETSKDLAKLCGDLGMVPGFRTARMYRGPFQRSIRGLFAVSTLELG